jgi:hypothetical protein
MSAVQYTLIWSDLQAYLSSTILHANRKRTGQYCFPESRKTIALIGRPLLSRVHSYLAWPLSQHPFTCTSCQQPKGIFLNLIRCTKSFLSPVSFYFIKVYDFIYRFDLHLQGVPCYCALLKTFLVQAEIFLAWWLGSPEKWCVVTFMMLVVASFNETATSGDGLL